MDGVDPPESPARGRVLRPAMLTPAAQPPSTHTWPDLYPELWIYIRGTFEQLGQSAAEVRGDMKWNNNEVSLLTIWIAFPEMWRVIISQCASGTYEYSHDQPPHSASPHVIGPWIPISGVVPNQFDPTLSDMIRGRAPMGPFWCPIGHDYLSEPQGPRDFHRMELQFVTYSSEELRIMIARSWIWQMRSTQPENPVITYELSVFDTVEQFMVHVYNLEADFIEQCHTYDEQSAYIVSLLHAMCYEEHPRPFYFRVTCGGTSRCIAMTHTLAIALLDRFCGLHQGGYNRYSRTCQCRNDVGPTPMIPDPTQDGLFRHPLCYINCDMRFPFDPALLDKFIEICYPYLNAYRKLCGLKKPIS